MRNGIIPRVLALVGTALFLLAADQAKADGWTDDFRRASHQYSQFTASKQLPTAPSAITTASAAQSAAAAAPRRSAAPAVAAAALKAPRPAVATTAPQVERPAAVARPAAIPRPSPPVATAPPAGGPSHSGMASYYWQGQRVASGGWFNPNAMTAAHKTLPFGTRVRVTHMGNGRSVEVTINDRGPFIAGRIIDLSKAAAGVIGMQQQGVAKVQMTVIGK